MARSCTRLDMPTLTKLVVMGLFTTILAGCGQFGEYLAFCGRQGDLKRAFDKEPSAELLRELDPENCFLLVGQVVLTKGYEGPILVIAVTDKFHKREIAAERILQAPVYCYHAYLPEGQYDLYFFADLDGNGYFDATEVIGQTSGTPIKISKTGVNDGLTIEGPSFALDANQPATIDFPVKVKVREQSYAYPSLDDEFFDPKYGKMGLYYPNAMLAHTQSFIFSLEKFDPGKTIVLFVHGIEGTPRDFKYLVDGLDRTRYQPCFYFYPSGMPLQQLGSLLACLLRLLDKTEGFHLNRMIVVAHSMGGLVALSALNQLCHDGLPPYLKGYVSFVSPYGGLESAKNAVEKAPVVVPSWRDVATASPFLKHLYRDNACQEMTCCMFFGYKSGESGDGTVTLQSQLEPKVHLIASKSYGFNLTHMGILNDDMVRQTFNGVLAKLNE